MLESSSRPIVPIYLHLLELPKQSHFFSEAAFLLMPCYTIDPFTSTSLTILPSVEAQCGKQQSVQVFQTARDFTEAVGCLQKCQKGWRKSVGQASKEDSWSTMEAATS